MYRYSLARYNDQLLKLGIVRVGTLHDFRKSEHRRGIADPQEGKKQVKKNIEHLHVSGPDDPNAPMLEMFNAIKVGHGSTVVLRNVQLAKFFDQPNCFVFCTSKRCSSATMAEFEGANSCVEIEDEGDFYELLTQALSVHTPIVFRGVFEVIYQDREEEWNGHDWGHHPALIKETNFKNQHELRAIWEPAFHQPIEPVLVGNFLLTRCCRGVHV